MRKIVFILIAVLIVVGATGCATNFTASNGKLSYGDISGSEAGEFSGSEKAMYILHPQLISIKAPNEELETIIDPALKEIGASEATNLTISYKMDFVAFLVQYITGGLLGMPSVVVTGMGVK